MARFKRIGIGFVLFLVLLIAARAYLPIAIRDYVNRTLDRVPDYDGSIGDVDLHLWRGAYNIQSIEIVKSSGKVPVPFFSSENTDFSVEWRALFDGKLVGEVELTAASLNFVSGPSEATSQIVIDPEWLQVIKDLFPLRINRFELNDSEIHFRDFYSEPKVDIALDNVHAVGTDFSNTRSPTEGLVAKIEGSAKAEGTADLTLKAELEPAARRPTFNLDLSLRELSIVKLNDFLRAYAAMDAEGGIISTDIEMAAADSAFRGFLKLIVKELEVISLETDSGIKLVWEGLVGLFAEIFENQRHSQFATEIPFSGRFDDTDIDIWHTLGAVLKNAFIEALRPGNEDRIDLGSEKEVD